MGSFLAEADLLLIRGSVSRVSRIWGECAARKADEDTWSWSGKHDSPVPVSAAGSKETTQLPELSDMLRNLLGSQATVPSAPVTPAAPSITP